MSAEVDGPRSATSWTSLGGCRAEAVYLDGDWQVVGPVGRPANADDLHGQLAGLNRAGGPLEVHSAGWMWAYPLVNQDDMAGHLLVRRGDEPSRTTSSCSPCWRNKPAPRLSTPACTHENARPRTSCAPPTSPSNER